MDLINLCTASPDDPLYSQAVHFCHRYLVGAFHYYEASTAGPKAHPIVYLPEKTAIPERYNPGIRGMGQSLSGIIPGFANWRQFKELSNMSFKA
jgi:hypothetical protein